MHIHGIKIITIHVRDPENCQFDIKIDRFLLFLRVTLLTPSVEFSFIICFFVCFVPHPSKGIIRLNDSENYLLDTNIGFLLLFYKSPSWQPRR